MSPASYQTAPPRVAYPLRAGNGTRTRDPNLGKVVLYQLSYAPLILGPRKRVPAGTRHLIGTLCQCQAKLRPDLNFSPRRRYKRAIRDIAMTKHVRRKKPTSPARAKPRAAARHAAAAPAVATAVAKPARKRGRRRGLLSGLGNHEHERDILDQYLHEVSKTPLLAQKEEIALARKVRSGDQEAMQELVKRNLRFVISVAKKYQNRGLPLTDLIGEGNVGLLTAARKFDP